MRLNHVPIFCEDRVHRGARVAPDGWKGRFEFGEYVGVNAADWICDDLAAKAGLVALTGEALLTAPRFRAWLSTTEDPVEDRFTKYQDIWYVQRSGLLVAKGWGDLVANGPQSPIITSQYDGVLVIGAPVWSNTNMDGSAASETLDCGSWTLDGVGPTALVGTNLEDEEPESWTNYTKIAPPLCAFRNRLYCFEQ